MEQPKDFITIDEFEKLCENEDPKNPKVDISLMVRRLPFLRTPGTWQVPLIKRGKDMRGRPITNYPNGYLYVLVDSNRIKNHIEEAIEDAYRRLAHKELDVESIGITKAENIIETGSNGEIAKKKKGKAGTQIKQGTINQDSEGNVR